MQWAHTGVGQVGKGKDIGHNRESLPTTAPWYTNLVKKPCSCAGRRTLNVVLLTEIANKLTKF